MKTIKNGAILLILVFSTIAFTQEKSISGGAGSGEIFDYASTHFPDNHIIKITMEQVWFKRTYELLLKDNIKLEFNRKLEIVEIEADSKLPDSVIPENIRNYVTTNYPSNFITGWELEGRRQYVSLNNGQEILFTKQGKFVRVYD